MPLVTTSQPTNTVVTLAEAKQHCRVVSTDTTHDTELSRLIVAATELIETRTGMKLTPVTMRYDLDIFPTGDICLPVYPIRSITSLAYDDEDDAEQTLTPYTDGSPVGDYWSYLDAHTPYLRAIVSWPDTKLNKPNAVRVTLEAGYNDRTDCPEELRHAVLVKIKEMFDHGGEIIEGMSVAHSVNTVEYLIAPHRRHFV